MPRIGIRELRQHASRYIEQVRQGATIQVTDNGTLVAELVPVGEARTVRERLLRDGQLIAAPGSFQIPTPVSVKEGAPSNAQILDELRSDRF
ncbi:MAG: type II toxin-antitoxin system prevent-host-death family antitoxin [Acidobacteria bacterium]|nr:type II toxin-antitoxin system prevent-host-death family antitoxin [Acidobacteriota bacterium]